MKILNKLGIIAFVLAIYFTMISSSGGIVGVSQSGCSCHGPSSPSTTVSISPIIGTSYTPGQIILYTITVTNSEMTTGTSGGGFNLSANIGTLSIVNADTRKIGTELTHNGTKLSDTGDVSWVVRWTAPLTGNNSLQLSVVGNAVNGMDGNSGDLWNFGIVDQVPLPVEFVSFDAKAKDNLVDLNWEITSQINASHFEMTRSSDGIHFETIGNVKITNKSVYSFQDIKPLPGMNYYQIKQIDIDNQIQFSKVVSQYGNASDISVYPRIVDNGQLHIDDLIDQKLNYELMGTNGNVVLRGQLDDIQNTIDVSAVSVGIYIIVLQSQSRTIKRTQKVVIAR